VSAPLDVVKGALEATGYPMVAKGSLNGVKGVATKWVGRCPHHGGRSRNSLALFEHSDGHVWVHCHSGCEPKAILGTVGLELRHCYPDGKWTDEQLNGVKFEPDDGRPDRLQVEQTNPKVWLPRFPTLVTTPTKGVLRLSSAELPVWGKVQTACLEQLECLPPWAPTPRDPWGGPHGLLQALIERMTKADHIVPAPELTMVGRVREILVNFVTNASADPAQYWAKAWCDGRRYVFRLENVVTTYQNELSWAARHHALTRWEIARGIEQLGGVVSCREYFNGKQQRISWVPVEALEPEQDT
jgi:hypothetical protein